MKKINALLMLNIKFSLIPLFIVLGSAVFADRNFQMSEFLTFSFLEQFVITYATFWILSLFYITLASLFSQNFRELCLQYMFNIKEQDERELYASSDAARTSHLLSFAFVLLLFFLSCLHFKYTERAATSPTDKGSKEISLIVGYKSFLQKLSKKDVDIESDHSFFSTQDYLIFIALFQVLTYRRTFKSNLK